MENKHFKIALIEDNEFYNNIFAQKLQFYLDSLKFELGFTYQLDTYINAEKAMDLLPIDIDLIFLDYYLGNDRNAPYYLSKINERYPLCEVVVISQHVFFTTKLLIMLQGATACIPKSQYAFLKSCSIVERLIHNRLDSNFQS